MTRRSLLTGGAFTGLAGAGAAAAVAGASPAGAPLPQSSRADEQAATVLREIRDELRLQRGVCSPASCGYVDSIRAQQKTFLKSRGKFPDFIDVGIGVWEALYDWHIQARQKPEIGRMPDGRYGMSFMLTTLVLRHDITESYLGIGYDTRE